MREVLRINDEKAPKDILLDGYDAAEDGVQDLSYQSVKYVVTHMLATGTMDSILALNFDRYSRSDAFLDSKEEIILELESVVTRFAVSGNESIKVCRGISRKDSRCRDVHEEYALNEISIEEPDTFIRQSMREYRGVKK